MLEFERSENQGRGGRREAHDTTAAHRAGSPWVAQRHMGQRWGQRRLPLGNAEAARGGGRPAHRNPQPASSGRPWVSPRSIVMHKTRQRIV